MARTDSRSIDRVAYLLSLVVLAPTQRRTPPDQLEVATFIIQSQEGFWAGHRLRADAYHCSTHEKT